MFFSDRSLTIISIACIMVIGLAIAVRVGQVSDPSRAVTKAKNIIQETRKLATEASFFNKPELETSPAPLPSTNASQFITASAYLVGNVKTGEIYFERNGSTARPIASMSKLMTAIVALETMDEDDKITITEQMTQVFPDASRLQAGEKFTVEQLLYPLLLNSSNVAAEALASSTDRMEFLSAMNSYAWEIGLPQSFFADPSGLSPYNAASPQGFFALAQFLFKSRQDILALTRIKKTSVATTSAHMAHDFTNIHPFVNDSRFIGGKTGRTQEAGETMLTILKINNQPIAIIVLGSAMGKRGEDTQILVEKVEKVID